MSKTKIASEIDRVNCCVHSFIYNFLKTLFIGVLEPKKVDMFFFWGKHKKNIIKWNDDDDNDNFIQHDLSHSLPHAQLLYTLFITCVYGKKRDWWTYCATARFVWAIKIWENSFYFSSSALLMLFSFFLFFSVRKFV